MWLSSYDIYYCRKEILWLFCSDVGWSHYPIFYCNTFVGIHKYGSNFSPCFLQSGMEGLFGHWNPSWNSMPWKHFSSPVERFQVGPPCCQTQWEGEECRMNLWQSQGRKYPYLIRGCATSDGGRFWDWLVENCTLMVEIGRCEPFSQPSITASAQLCTRKLPFSARSTFKLWQM